MAQVKPERLSPGLIRRKDGGIGKAPQMRGNRGMPNMGLENMPQVGGQSMQSQLPEMGTVRPATLSKPWGAPGDFQPQPYKIPNPEEFNKAAPGPQASDMVGRIQGANQQLNDLYKPGAQQIPASADYEKALKDAQQKMFNANYGGQLQVPGMGRGGSYTPPAQGQQNGGMNMMDYLNQIMKQYGR